MNSTAIQCRSFLSRGGCAAMIAGLVLSVVPRLHAGWLDWLLHHDLQVITVTDLSPRGALLRPPTTVEPVYYVGVSIGYREFGGLIAGDKLPAAQDMVRAVVRALAQSGYQPADEAHPASQIILFCWGTLNPEISSGDPDYPPSQANRYQMVRFLGGEKLGLVTDNPQVWAETLDPGLRWLSPDANAIWAVSKTELYVVALMGFEYPLRTPKHPRMLWRSKISCPSLGFGMADTLPTMLAIAAPYIGHDTARPVWIKAEDKFKPVVHIGPVKFEQYLESGELPVVDASTPPKGRKR